MDRMRLRAKAGFTLIELVIVIAIIGILAAVAIPRFIDLRAEAYRAQFDGVVGAVRAGILLVSARNQTLANPAADTFPPNLEVAWGGSPGGAIPATLPSLCDADPCFELVLQQPIGDGIWEHTTPMTYTFRPPNGAARTCTYTQVEGAAQVGRFNCT